MGLGLVTHPTHATYTSPSKSLTTEQGMLSYHQLGKGKQTIVLLGGRLGFSNWNLEPIQQLLAPHYRVLLMDMRGIGENKQPIEIRHLLDQTTLIESITEKTPLFHL